MMNTVLELFVSLLHGKVVSVWDIAIYWIWLLSY